MPVLRNSRRVGEPRLTKDSFKRVNYLVLAEISQIRWVSDIRISKRASKLVAIEHIWPRSRPSACSVEEPQTGENAGFRSYRNGLASRTDCCLGEDRI